MLAQLKQQLLLPQFALGVLETAFNVLIARSAQTSLSLRKLVDKTLHIQLNHPNLSFFIVFNEQGVDLLSRYESEPDCTIILNAEILPQLTNKQKLSELINNNSLILNGDIQVLQHFTALLEQLEKDPAELLSPFLGDVMAQTSTDFVGMLLHKAKLQFNQNSQHIIEGLINERPVLVHRLQMADFCDQVSELEQQAVRLEQQFVKIIAGLNTNSKNSITK